MLEVLILRVLILEIFGLEILVSWLFLLKNLGLEVIMSVIFILKMFIYNSIPCLSTLLITRLGLVSSHITYILSNDVYIELMLFSNNLLSLTLQVHCHQLGKFINLTAL